MSADVDREHGGGKEGSEGWRRLSARLSAVVSMVEPGSLVADVGCDHGYVAIRLVLDGICPHVYAMDVREAPLNRARLHVGQAGVSEQVTLLLSDGLKRMPVVSDPAHGWMPAADTLVAAGMGGRLISRIMIDSEAVFARMRGALLQPQSEPWLVRGTLRRLGYVITREEMLLEEGKYYVLISARNQRYSDLTRVPSGSGGAGKESGSAEAEAKKTIASDRIAQPGMEAAERYFGALWEEAADRYGSLLLAGHHPRLLCWLKEALALNQRLLREIELASGRGELAENTVRRREELFHEARLLGRCLSWYERSGMSTVRVNVGDIYREYELPVTYEQVAADYQDLYGNRILLAVQNHRIRELKHHVREDGELSFLTIRDTSGRDTYLRSMNMLLSKAVSDVAGGSARAGICMEYAVGGGYYCVPRGDLVQETIRVGEDGEAEIDPAFVDLVRARMRELVAAGLPFEKQGYSMPDGLRLFKAQGMEDKVRLFRYRRVSHINIYCLDGYYDYYFGYMVPDTSYLERFDLLAYKRGMLLMIPDRTSPDQVSRYQPSEQLFGVFERTGNWGRRMGVDTVADLNDGICDGRLEELILVQEALQEERIAQIAREIAEGIGGSRHIRFVMIAGPSSSGKTTFSHRLSIQLKAHGLVPHPIALDDYFVNRENTPRDADGNYDFECLEAIDVEAFNRDMQRLLAGERVELPHYDFKTGKRVYRGDVLRLGEEDILVLEGIHGLNDALSYSLPLESKYKIYISALTCLSVDEHNRISTTDGRLLRRLVRDARTRGTSALQTLRMWESVRRGERKYIFPYQESADVMFNSALLYELAVLKQYAEPLLYSVPEEEPEALEAKRLLKFLDYFLGVNADAVPNHSILREFIGGSCFRV